ncbi:hypothetical protein ACFSJW_02115 [Flavobacterium artemisiae]|uniref:Uncharacterized protein n=1 Tax=Flavobacterium artemisiae TaxID=2126556 RepID=A0ABW4HID1_9FLAO
MTNKFQEYKDSDQKFHRVKIVINKERSYEEQYCWDKLLQRQELLDYAEVIYRWVNERMMFIKDIAYPFKGFFKGRDFRAS